jgi:ribokinase
VAPDVVVAAPTFLDLSLVGLDALPALGEERFAADIVRSAGGGGITAVAAARLGLSVTVAAPLGDDEAGAFLLDLFEQEGVAVTGRRSRRTPTTMVMAVGGEGAMVTVDHGVRAYAAEVAALEPRAVVATLEVVHTVPECAAAYVVCGEDDARAYAGRPPRELMGVRALFLSDREALALSAAPTVEAAAEQLAATAQTVMVTLDADRMLALVDGRHVEVPRFEGDPIIDRTGIRDVLAAAHCWADLHGAEPEESVWWAALHTRLTAGFPSAVRYAVDEARLLDAGHRAGLAVPAGRR